MLKFAQPGRAMDFFDCTQRSRENNKPFGSVLFVAPLLLARPVSQELLVVKRPQGLEGVAASLTMGQGSRLPRSTAPRIGGQTCRRVTLEHDASGG